MFTTNTNFQTWALTASFFDCNLHQTANTIAIQLLEWVLWQNTFVNINTEEVAFSIIAAVAKGHLSKIVGAKGEEFGVFSDFVCSNSSTWDFNHRAKFVINGDTLLSHNVFGNLDQSRLNGLQFVHMTGQGDHDFRMRVKTIQFDVTSGFKDSANLHFHDVRIDDAKADTAQAHHWVAFM